VEIGQLETVKMFLELKPEAASAKITFLDETALHVAVNAGHKDIVEKLVDVMSEEDLAILDSYGNTALADAIDKGKYQMAMCMLRKNKNLVRIKDEIEEIPVIQAIDFGHTKFARYLYFLTPLADLMPENGSYGATLCAQAIRTGALGINFFNNYFRIIQSLGKIIPLLLIVLCTTDIALDLIQRCRRLALTLDHEGCSPLYALASMPYAFPSGYQLVFWKRWIYSCKYIFLFSL
jgi:hypothetical protein